MCKYVICATVVLLLRKSLSFCFFSCRGSSRYEYGLAHLELKRAPFDDVIPFLSEHVAPSDQLLFLGASTDMALQLLKVGYGGSKDNLGSMTLVDSPGADLEDVRSMALADPQLAERIKIGKLRIEAVDLTKMPDICKQSVFDAIVDYGALDSLLIGSAGKSGMLKCIDQLQDGVRLGNILVCLSSLDKEQFCPPFEERFGWVQELDGDPGEISAWYRGKTNIEATKSNFAKLGLQFYVYTNTDNC